MIIVVSGVPGAGKSYWAVYHLLKGRFKDCIIFTNLELKQRLNRVNLVKFEKKYFTVNYVKKLKERIQSHIVYIIDEAQVYFRSMPDSDVRYFFEYHRHLGIDIVLITQNPKLIHETIRILAEYEIKAQRKSLRFLNRFVYYYYQAGEKFHVETLPYDHDVFSFYRSFQFSTETIENRSAYTLYLILLGLFITLAVFSYSYLQSKFFAKVKSKVKSSSPSFTVASNSTIQVPFSYSLLLRTCDLIRNTIEYENYFCTLDFQCFNSIAGKFYTPEILDYYRSLCSKLNSKHNFFPKAPAPAIQSNEASERVKGGTTSERSGAKRSGAKRVGGDLDERASELSLDLGWGKVVLQRKSWGVRGVINPPRNGGLGAVPPAGGFGGTESPRALLRGFASVSEQTRYTLFT